MIVLDASAVVEFLLGTPTGVAVGARIQPVRLNCPHLLGVEVLQALRGLVAGRVVDEAEADRYLADLEDLPLHRWKHEPLFPRAWQLRENVTAYDAMYVALAETLEAPLLTTDARLARSTGHSAQIEVVTV